jgi:hypothetical protein
MSLIGKALLTLCDNNFQINLNEICSEHPLWNRNKVRVVAIMLGLNIVGGS